MQPTNRISPSQMLTLAAISLFLFANLSINPMFGGSQAMAYNYSQNTRAPEFPSNMEWLNTGRDLSLSELRGKVVLLDFWTYCCINCMHVLPKLANLEEKYGGNLVVIGVHSAKFEGERESENIRQAIMRYNIHHPVVNDHEFSIWRSYGIRAWPTMVLIDPEGYVVDIRSGEGGPEYFDPIIEDLIERFSRSGDLDSNPLNITLEESNERTTLLSYPGKVHVNPDGDRLFIADSNHNRILVVSLPDGQIIDQIGSGANSTMDGSFEEAGFNNPQGMAFVENRLYVADTGNHMIREADFENRTVSTIAGTGQQAFAREQGGPAHTTPLASPWDVVYVNNRLYVAMAGPHQLWVYNPDNGEIHVWAGSGREDIIDGPHFWAALAQPSGIDTDGERLYFADSEVSAIRSAGLSPEDSVKTIVGRGLFDFGDRDGSGDNVRLQHPLGVAWHDGLLYIADTYNNKVKTVDPESRTTRSYAGSGREGLRDGSLSRARFDEPGGLDVGPDGTIYVADTNNHSIRIISPESESVTTLQLSGLPELSMDESTSQVITIDPWEGSSGQGAIQVDLQFPEGLKLNVDGGIRILLHADSPSVVQSERVEIFSTTLPVTIPVEWIAGNNAINLDLNYYYCQDSNEGLCYIGQERLRIPIVISESRENSTLSIIHDVTGINE